MNVTGSAHQLTKLGSQIYDLFIYLDQVFFCLNCTFFIPEHKRIVSQRLDLQIIVEIYQSGNLRIGSPAKKGLI